MGFGLKFAGALSRREMGAAHEASEALGKFSHKERRGLATANWQRDAAAP